MSFLAFAAEQGLAIRTLYADGKIHRCPTYDKPRSDNGAYCLDGDRGWIQNWAQGDKVVWWNDPNAAPWSAEQKAAAERKRREAAKERMAGQATAAHTAKLAMRDAEFIVPDEGRETRGGRVLQEAVPGHPYLVRKGFPLEPFHQDAAGQLLVPMRDARTYDVIGLQRIKPNGEKKFLTGQRAKGAVFVVGAREAREQWLVEGYATGLSVHAALRALYRKAAVWVCFSAGNIEHVASLKIGTHVFADHDASERGKEAAETTGLPWAMSPIEGEDGNDVHARRGIPALCDLIRKL